MAIEQAKVIDGQLCISSAVMQEAFGVSRQALGNWAKSGCPKSKPGWWPLIEVVRWRGMGASGKADKGKPDADRSLGELKLKYEGELKRLQTEQQEMKNAIQAGEYVAVKEVISELARHHTDLKRSLTGLSRKITTEIAHLVEPSVARQIERGLSNLVNDALRKMSTGENYEPSRRKYIKTR